MNDDKHISSNDDIEVIFIQELPDNEGRFCSVDL